MKTLLRALRKLGPFLMGVILGVDMGLGLLVFAFSTLFTQEVSLLNLAYCVFMAHAPDIDMILFMFKSVKKKLKIPCHRVIGHHPVLILPLFFLLGLWILPGKIWVLQGVILLIGHFIHLASCPVHEKFWKPSDSTIFHFYDIPCCQRFRTVESDLDLRARSAAITDTQKWSSEITCPSSTIRERGIGTHETRRTWISEIREDIIS